MNDNNGNKEKKGGFLSSLSGLFRGGSSAIGGASSGMGSSGMGGLGGLFATKAGIVGMVLGGATIAAGVGVLYNFVGTSSKPVYSPDLFQDTYYEEEASRAGQERAMSRDSSAAASSTLDMFREQARKDNLGLAGEGGGNAAKASADSEVPADGSADASAAAPSADGSYGGSSAGGAAGGGMPRLNKSSGFGGKGGGAGSGTSIPRMQSGGGLSGGIGGKFQSVYRAPAQANAGKTSGMTASAARMKNSPKYAVPNVNRKGAYGQAKFAGKMGAKAGYSADAAGSRTNAEQAFSGETGGAGDVGTPGSGAGLSGAGISGGNSLKGNDPSLNSNESTPPKVPDPEDIDPWQGEEDKAMNGMMWAGGLILVTMALSKLARYLATTGWGIAASVYVFYAAMATAAAAIFYALKVVMAGFKMYSQYGQKMMGGIYILTGLMLIYKAYEALMSAYNDSQTASAQGDTPMTKADWKGVDAGTYKFVAPTK